MKGSGAYIIRLKVKKPLAVHVGSIGEIRLPAGSYLYVGSARRGIAPRVARHRRLAETKSGKVHWHIDHLLVHPHVEWAGATAFAGKSECCVSRRIAARKGSSVPARRFGASDCRSGCVSHFYRVGPLEDLTPEFIRTGRKTRPHTKLLGTWFSRAVR